MNQVFYAKWVQGIDPFIYSFLSFSMALLFFLGLNLIMSIKKTKFKPTFHYKYKKRELQSIIVLNLITAIIFICYYYANKYIEPAIVSAIEIGIGPIIALVLGLAHQKNMQLKLDIMVCLGILLGTIILVWASIVGVSGVKNDALHTYRGLITAFICGIGMVSATFYSKKLSNLGWKTYKILAHRFYLLVPVTLIFIINQKGSYIMSVLIHNWSWIVIFTFLGLIIPLYLIQVGIKYCSPLFVSITLSFGPVFTFFFQILDPRVKWSWISLLGIGCLCLFVISKVLIQNVKGGKKSKEEKIKYA